MAGNKSLKAAVRAKEDEFYTQLTDIEKELRHYKQHFETKQFHVIATIRLKVTSLSILCLILIAWELKN